MRTLAALALCLALAAAPAEAAPHLVSAEYKVSMNGIPGARVHESYVLKGDAYSIESRTVTEGIVKLLRDETLVHTSAGRLGAHGLEPSVFERRQANDRSRDVRTTFDWANGVMRSEYRGESGEVDLPAGTQDRLSMMYQFMHMVPRESVEVLMSNGRKVERYTYRLMEEARLKTPAGEFDTLRYERVITEPKQGRAQVWLARDRHFFPVRVVFEDSKGARVDQLLVTLETR